MMIDTVEAFKVLKHYGIHTVRVRPATRPAPMLRSPAVRIRTVNDSSTRAARRTVPSE